MPFHHLAYNKATGFKTSYQLSTSQFTMRLLNTTNYAKAKEQLAKTPLDLKFDL